jgi:hypothetical protein
VLLPPPLTTSTTVPAYGRYRIENVPKHSSKLSNDQSGEETTKLPKIDSEGIDVFVFARSDSRSLETVSRPGHWEGSLALTELLLDQAMNGDISYALVRYSGTLFEFTLTPLRRLTAVRLMALVPSFLAYDLIELL